MFSRSTADTFKRIDGLYDAHLYPDDAPDHYFLNIIGAGGTIEAIGAIHFASAALRDGRSG